MSSLHRWTLQRLIPAPGALQALALMLASSLGFTLMNAITRMLSADLHPFVISFWRTVFGVLFFAPLFFRYGMAPLRTRRLGMLVGRGMLSGVAITTFFMGISLTPLAKASALFLTTPLFATALAVAFLGERIRLRRISALIAGFAGALVVMRPGAVPLDLGAGYVLASAVFSGFIMVVVKSLSRTNSSVTITLYGTLFAVPLTLLAALTQWVIPTAEQFAWMVLMGGLGSSANLMIAQAIKQVDIAALTPMDFTKLLWAALVGYLLFGEIPDGGTWIGGTIIFAAATYIAYRERTVRAQPPPPPTA